MVTKNPNFKGYDPAKIKKFAVELMKLRAQNDAAWDNLEKAAKTAEGEAIVNACKGLGKAAAAATAFEITND